MEEEGEERDREAQRLEAQSLLRELFLILTADKDREHYHTKRVSLIRSAQQKTQRLHSEKRNHPNRPE